MIKIISFIICALFISIFLKNIKSSFPIYISIFVIVIISLYSLTFISPTIEFINNLSQKIEIESSYLTVILKCVAICFLCNICTNICKDAGENSLGYAAELVCRCSVIALTLPIYVDIFNWIIKLWENI